MGGVGALPYAFPCRFDRDLQIALYLINLGEADTAVNEQIATRTYAAEISGHVCNLDAIGHPTRRVHCSPPDMVPAS